MNPFPPLPRKTIIFLVFLLCSCTDHAEKKKDGVSQPAIESASFHYDLNHPTNKWELPGELKEISGIAKLDNTTMLAIEDLHPVLYVLKLDSGEGKITDTMSFFETAKEKFDMEDIAIIKDTVYALWSHGSVFKIKDWKHKKEVIEIKTGLSKENNTEGMAYDPATGNLLIACKNESEMENEKKSTRSIFEYDVKADSLKDEPFLLIRSKDFKELAGEKPEFYPSAIGVHPVTHDIYILSTRGNKCIAVYSHDGNLKSFEYLDKDLLPQPEGICFDPAGNIYISTEGKHGESPYIYEFDAAKK